MKNKAMRRAPAQKPKPARYEITKEGAPQGAEGPGEFARTGKQMLSATEVARNFSDVISRVCYKGETFIVEKGGKPMCEISPVEVRGCSGAELLALLDRLPRPEEEFLAAVEAVSARQAAIESSPWDK